jgi:hypothetical protein
MNVNIELSEEQRCRLENKARHFNTSAEKLIEILVREFADADSEIEVDDAMTYVLEKNRELYERLAR